MITGSDSPSATAGNTLTPLLFLMPPERGSVCNVPAIIVEKNIYITVSAAIRMHKQQLTVKQNDDETYCSFCFDCRVHVHVRTVTCTVFKSHYNCTVFSILFLLSVISVAVGQHNTTSSNIQVGCLILYVSMSQTGTRTVSKLFLRKILLVGSAAGVLDNECPDE